MLSFATLQLVNLVQTTFLLGFNGALSFVSIPTILLSPSPILAVRQWNLQFEKGRKTATPLCATSLILSLILAYATSPWAETASRRSPTHFYLYCASSALSFLVFPFTIRMINPLNNALSEKCKREIDFHYTSLPEKDAGMQTMRDHNQISMWGTLNWFRACTFAVLVGINSVALLQNKA